MEMEEKRQEEAVLDYLVWLLDWTAVPELSVW